MNESGDFHYSAISWAMAIATLAYFLILLGLVFRKKRSLHIKLMLSGVGLDLGLVLFLELTRDAIGTASSFTLSFSQQIHIFFSLLTVILYLPILYLGIRMVKTPSLSVRFRTLHIRLGLLAFVFRTIGFLFMFSFIGHHH